MNFLAGYLLIVTRSEEKSFWLMDALIGRILPDYYTRDMLGVRVDQEVLGELLATKLPHVAAHVASHGVPWPLLTARWFLCLYVDVLPVETVLRVWDSLFYEGSKVLFRVAVTLVRHHQAQVLAAAGFPAIVAAFRAMAVGSFARDCHTFMQRTFVDPGSLPMATITAQRDSIRARLLQEAGGQEGGRGGRAGGGRGGGGGHVGGHGGGGGGGGGDGDGGDGGGGGDDGGGGGGGGGGGDGGGGGGGGDGGGGGGGDGGGGGGNGGGDGGGGGGCD
ncbi:growth hormone-regulated TBC protein 1-like [Lethenteron reissneri]|uniref:growth hormone-regulated TBC protein 1-like n=1 Tax=Lethenteron reissneri TaxID=7753 RepID=UPI002AB7D3DC|nr:growth hormone-regulated TBC protein 1-like [Lethenteron reissneri]